MEAWSAPLADDPPDAGLPRDSAPGWADVAPPNSLEHFGARRYDPSPGGRWLSQEPLGLLPEPASLSAYPRPDPEPAPGEPQG